MNLKQTKRITDSVISSKTITPGNINDYANIFSQLSVDEAPEDVMKFLSDYKDGNKLTAVISTEPVEGIKTFEVNNLYLTFKN